MAYPIHELEAYIREGYTRSFKRLAPARSKQTIEPLLKSDMELRVIYAGYLHCGGTKKQFYATVSRD